MFSLKNFLMATLLIFAVSVGGIAEAGIVTDRFPFWCYVDHQVDTYDQPNGRRIGYISADVDLVRVTNFRSDGWFYGDYPISGGRRIARWFKISEVCSDLGYSNRGTNVRGAQRVFRTKNSNETIGSVSNNEGVIVLADNGNRAQIIYRLDNGTGYKIGWVPSSSVGGNGGGNSTNIKGDANNDGKVDENDINLMKAYIVGNVGDSAINKNNADVNGDGQINILDMSAALSMSKNNQNTNNSGNSQPTPNRNLQSLINEFTRSRQIWDDRESGQLGTTCFGFANYIFRSLHGVRAALSYKKNQRYILTDVSSGVTCRYSGTIDENVLHNLFQQCSPGDFIQATRSDGYSQHSMIFVSYDANSRKVRLFDANFVTSSEPKNLIQDRTQTITRFLNRFQKASVYTK